MFYGSEQVLNYFIFIDSNSSNFNLISGNPRIGNPRLPLQASLIAKV